MRADKFIQQKFSLKSRTYAENLILTGRVLLNGKILLKPSADVSDDDDISIIADEGFASQGAYKLDAAIEGFKIDVGGLSCADIGCSNGGFSDVLLRRGAQKILAIDVGECALPKEMLASGQVTFLKANARALPASLEQVDFVCADLSFISLKLVLGEIFKLLKDGGKAVVLVKPQFELDKKSVSKSGLVTNEKYRRQAVDGIKAFASAMGFELRGEMISPIRYVDKNVEYLLFLTKPSNAAK